MGISTAARPAKARLPGGVWLASFLLSLDGLILAFAIADIAGLDLSSSAVAPGGTQAFDAPVFPWVVGALSLLSVTAGWLASGGRRLAFVLGVALAWVVLGAIAFALGSGWVLLVERLVIVAALVHGRRAFGS
jgi:hypothetical protein